MQNQSVVCSDVDQELHVLDAACNGQGLCRRAEGSSSDEEEKERRRA